MKSLTGVSVVIPVYNGAAHLEEALASVYQQTRAPDEIIVVDDGSTDDSPAILEKHRASLRCIRTANQGLASARNEGVRAARGPFVAFLDQDDRWLPKKVETFLAWTTHYPQAEFLFSDAVTLSPEGRRLRRMACDLGPGDFFQLLFRQNRVVSSTVVLTKSLWTRGGPFRKDFTHPAAVVDYEFFLRASRLGPALYIGDVLTEYRIHASSSLRSRLREVESDHLKVLSMYEGDATLTPTQKETARAIAYFDSGVRHWAAGDLFSARKAFALAGQCRSVAWKACLYKGLTFLPRLLIPLARAVRGKLFRMQSLCWGTRARSPQVRYYGGRAPI